MQTYPDDLRIRNNLAEALALKGDRKQALAIIRETLDLAPNNFFARSVRCRLAYFQGQTDESRTDAEMLLNLKPRQISDLAKAAQSFAYIGDHDKIRWAYDYAKQQGWLGGSPTDVALLTNLFATSLAFVGDTKSAWPLWKQAVKLASQATTAAENLDDSRQPAGKQWGPAYFCVPDWLSQTEQDGIRKLAEVAARSKGFDSNNPDNDAISKATDYLFRKHPDIARAIPGMLKRGDAASQQLALLIARGSHPPDVHSALLTYVRGSRGTDEARSQLLMTLQESGHAFESPLTFFPKAKRIKSN